MGWVIFFVIIYFVFLASGNKNKNTKGARNVLTEVDKLLKEGSQKIQDSVDQYSSNQVSTDKYSQRSYGKSANTLYKKSIPLESLVLVSGESDNIKVSADIYVFIGDVEQFKYSVGSNDKIIRDFVIYHLQSESATFTTEEIMDTSLLKESVERAVMSDLYSLGVSRITLDLYVDSIIAAESILKNVPISITSTREVDYGKQITDELMSSIGNTEKEIDDTIKSLEDEMDKLVKDLGG